MEIKTTSKKKYYESLPKKRMGAGVLIFNQVGEILIVKSNYKNHWSLPGGVVEKNESPLAACRREVYEETNLELRKVKLLVIDYVSVNSEIDENIQFIFYGGRVANEKIKIDSQEIESFQFVKPRQTIRLLSVGTSRRVKVALLAQKKDKIYYLENGLLLAKN